PPAKKPIVPYLCNVKFRTVTITHLRFRSGAQGLTVYLLRKAQPIRMRAACKAKENTRRRMHQNRTTIDDPGAAFRQAHSNLVPETRHQIGMRSQVVIGILDTLRRTVRAILPPGK